MRDNARGVQTGKGGNRLTGPPPLCYLEKNHSYVYLFSYILV
jgi:hypothetical protein